jgi:hypothetical protein
MRNANAVATAAFFAIVLFFAPVASAQTGPPGGQGNVQVLIDALTARLDALEGTVAGQATDLVAPHAPSGNLTFPYLSDVDPKTRFELPIR